MKLYYKIKQKIIFEAKKILKLDHGNWSYSQEGEDLILSELFAGIKTGFYIDIGALHPRRFSNTYHFYKQGWRGINIDATPGTMPAFNRERPRDINLELGISSQQKLLTLFQFSEPALNTFSEKIATQRIEDNAILTSMTKIESFPLNIVLDNNLPENTTIDLLDIDAEGYDLEILMSNNWDKYRPKIILAETPPSTDIENISNDNITSYLHAKDYKQICRTNRTLFFKDNTQLLST